MKLITTFPLGCYDVLSVKLRTRRVYPELAKAAATDCSPRPWKEVDPSGGQGQVAGASGKSSSTLGSRLEMRATRLRHPRLRPLFVSHLRTLRDHVDLAPSAAPWHGSPRSLGASKPQRPILLGRRSRSEPKPVAPECLGEFEHDQNNCRCAQRQAEIVPVQPAEAEQAPHGGH